MVCGFELVLTLSVSWILGLSRASGQKTVVGVQEDRNPVKDTSVIVSLGFYGQTTSTDLGAVGFSRTRSQPFAWKAAFNLSNKRFVVTCRTQVKIVIKKSISLMAQWLLLSTSPIEIYKIFVKNLSQWTSGSRIPIRPQDLDPRDPLSRKKVLGESG